MRRCFYCQHQILQPIWSVIYGPEYALYLHTVCNESLQTTTLKQRGA